MVFMVFIGFCDVFLSRGSKTLVLPMFFEGGLSKTLVLPMFLNPYLQKNIGFTDVF